VARPRFSPSADQRRAINWLAKLARRQTQTAGLIDLAIGDAAEQDIPVSVIADTLGWQRKTVYRHLGRDM
jgi:hypothetical protein